MSRPLTPALWLLVLVTFSGTAAIHTFVPALASASRELHTTPAAIQMAISFYVLGLAFGQLAYGPLSDRYGRRPLLLGGLALYTLASVVCMLATRIDVLVIARFVQALGGCAGVILPRAIVRDSGDADEALRRLSLINLIALAGPGLGPLFGGFLVSSVGWRAIFLFFTLIGLTGFVLSWRLLPETHAARGAQRAGSLASSYAGLLRSPAFIGYVLGGACSSTAFYAFITASPFIFIDQLKQPVEAVGLYLGLLMVAVGVGSLGVRQLARRMGQDRLLSGSNLLSLVAVLALLAHVVFGAPDTLVLMAGMTVYCMCIGAANPILTARVMSVNPRVTGSSIGLYGFVQMAFGALCSTLAGVGRDHAVTALTVLVTASLVAQIAFRVAMRAPAEAG